MDIEVFLLNENVEPRGVWRIEPTKPLGDDWRLRISRRLEENLRKASSLRETRVTLDSFSYHSVAVSARLMPLDNDAPRTADTEVWVVRCGQSVRRVLPGEHAQLHIEGLRLIPPENDIDERYRWMLPAPAGAGILEITVAEQCWEASYRACPYDLDAPVLMSDAVWAHEDRTRLLDNFRLEGKWRDELKHWHQQALCFPEMLGIASSGH